MIVFATFATFGCVLVALVTVAAPKCSSLDGNACSSQLMCQWNAELKTCKSSLPCALEATEQDCIVNTWSCTWTGTNCMKKLLVAKSPSVLLCDTFANQNDCLSEKRCIWKEDACTRRPTIILSVADDLSWYDVSWHNPRARTPVLERLRSRGVDLDRHYTSRYCAPTRAMLFTGRYAWRMGLQTDLNLNPTYCMRCAVPKSHTLLPEYLKNYGGYSTYAFGKWHLGFHRDDLVPTARGFDGFLGFFGGSVDNHKKPSQFITTQCACKGVTKGACNRYAARMKLECARGVGMLNMTAADGLTTLFTDANIPESTTDLFLANRASETILAVDPNSPLFVYIGWAAPHNPVYAPDEFQVALRSSVPPFGSDSPLDRVCADDQRATLLAMVAVMDEGHRRVIDALESVGRFDSTIFLFLTDNGGNTPRKGKSPAIVSCSPGMNYPLRGSKFTWFEGGVRAIAFASSVDFIHPSKRGTIYRSVISVNDWVKTLISAAQIKDNLELPSDGIDQWGGISRTAPQLEFRSEIPMQVWVERSRYAILFSFQGALWKIIQGYPFSGYGSGAAKSAFKSYSIGDIFQPWELPANEAPFAFSDGYTTKYNCNPFCLFNLDSDPYEFNELSSKETAVMVYALSLIDKYRNLNERVLTSGLCDSGYYALDAKDVTDASSVRYARSCGAFLPWLKADGTPKPLCSKPYVVINQKGVTFTPEDGKAAKGKKKK